MRYAIVLVVVPLLLCSCSGPYGRGWGDAPPLHRAAHRGDTAGIRAAIAAGASPDSPANIPAYDFAAGEVMALDTPLMLAVRAKHAGATRELFASGAKPDPAVVPWAVQNGVEFVQLFLDAGFDPHTPIHEWPLEGGTALDWATYYENDEVVRLLFEAGAVPARGSAPRSSAWYTSFRR